MREKVKSAVRPCVARSGTTAAANKLMSRWWWYGGVSLLRCVCLCSNNNGSGASLVINSNNVRARKLVVLRPSISLFLVGIDSPPTNIGHDEFVYNELLGESRARATVLAVPTAAAAEGLAPAA